MWRCLKCKEDVEDTMGVCWNCQADQEGVFQQNISSVPDRADEEYRQFLNTKFTEKNCVLCRSPLRFVDTRRFHDGPNWGALHDLGELFVGRTTLDMYVCPTCQRVEFFVSDPNP